MKFMRLSIEAGLSQSVVNVICQDTNGFIWIGTQDGLNRYDGYRIKVYRNESFSKSFISNNDFISIILDKSGKLWIGASDDHISRYETDSDSINSMPIKSQAEFMNPHNQIMTIREDNNQNLWIGTYGGGLIKYNTVKNKYQRFKENAAEESIPSNSVSSLYIDKGDQIWIGTYDKGLALLNSHGFMSFSPDKNKPMLSNKIRFIFEQAHDYLLLGTEKGLYRFCMSKKEFTDLEFDSATNDTLRNEYLTSICEDKGGNLWIGTRFNGIIFIDKKNGRSNRYCYDKADPYSLSNNAIINVYNDSSNVTWIGTLGGGVSKIDCEAKKFYHVPELKDESNGITSNNIMAFAEDKYDNLWIGTFGCGVFMLNTLTNEVKSYIDTGKPGSFKGKSVFGLIAENNADMWIATSVGGLVKFHFGKEEFSNFKFSKTSGNDIYSILKDKDNPEKYLWIGSGRSGLLRFDKEKEEFKITASVEDSGIKLSSNRVKTLFIDDEKNLWVGTITDGLNRIDLNKNKILIYTSNDNAGSLSDNQINTILQDKKGNLWFGTHNSGLNRYLKENGKFEVYNVEKGMPNNTIQGILEDEKGSLWISTNKGITKFRPSDKNFRNYDSDDGLQSNEFNESSCYKSRNGTFFFGGINGYNYFKPEEIKDNPYIPNIVITDFQIFNNSVKNSPDNPFLKKNITETKEIILSYRESVFSFEFTALSFNNPGKNLYAYMMEGFDKKWIYCGTRRFATYTNLEPGDYVFRVKGSNNDGIWNEEGTSLKIKITPPYWKTLWFKSFGLMSLIGAIGIAYQKKLSKVEGDKKLQEEFSRKLLESQEDERKRIANDLHHTIAHDILITKNKAVLGLKKAGDSKAIKNILNEISELSSGTLKDVRSISYNLHPHQIERLGMTKALRSIINGISNSSEIKFNCNIENIDGILSKEQEINIFRIIQECSNNIIKHSDATEASLNIIKDTKTLTITVWDNGKGIPKNRIDGLGLTGIEERVKLYQGELVIESAQTKGTVIAISLPIN